MDKTWGRDDDSMDKALPFGSSDSRCSTVCIVGIHKKTGAMAAVPWASPVPWAFHEQPGPSPGRCNPQGVTGLGWPDVKKGRSEAQSYIRRFLGPAIEPPCCCCQSLGHRAEVPVLAPAGGREVQGQGRGEGGPPNRPEAE